MVTHAHAHSLEDKAHRIGLLQRAYAIWTERSVKSKDAVHAANVLRAILSKVKIETPDSSNMSVDDDSSSTLVAGTPSSGGFLDERITVDPFYGSETTTANANFDHIMSLDDFFKTTDSLDWVSRPL